MKNIYILRHAKASTYAKSGKDFDRNLTDKGYYDAILVGKYMRYKHYVPDVAYCSPSRRTLDTLNLTWPEQLQTFTLHMPTTLYQASSKTLFNYLKALDAPITNVLIIAHNPGIHELVLRLMKQELSIWSQKIEQDYPPAAFTAFQSNIESWQDLKAHKNEMIDHLRVEDITEEQFNALSII